MTRILVVDDDKDVAELVCERLDECLGRDYRCHIELSFDEAMGQIRSLRPHVVVLDIWDGKSQESTPSGTEVLNQIWDQQFCPVVVYSAYPPPDIKVNPFIHKITKEGPGDSTQNVLQAIETMQPHIDALQKGEECVWDAFADAMKYVAPSAIQQFKDASVRQNIIVRAGRRRMAALMDEPLPPDTALAPWEQYLFPPVTNELLLGDILRVADGNSEDPCGFRLVLTPSCDIQQSHVKEILVAKCRSLAEGLSKAGLDHKTSEKKLKAHPLFSQGFSQSVLSLPRLEGKIPPMVADFRALELIPVEDVGQYCRIASLDSPFRESVAWAYLQFAGRPGLPNRDFAPWLRDIKPDPQES